MCRRCLEMYETTYKTSKYCSKCSKVRKVKVKIPISPRTAGVE